MRWIDNFLLDRVYQPICDALYHRVGNCTALALSSLIGSMVFCVLMIIRQIWRTITTGFTGQLLDLAIFSVVFQFTILAGVGGLTYTLARFPVPQGQANPLRFLLFPTRIFFVLTMPIVSGYLIWLSYVVSSTVEFNLIYGVIRDLLLICGLYFASCNNEPPMRTQWVARPAI